MSFCRFCKSIQVYSNLLIISESQHLRALEKKYNKIGKLKTLNVWIDLEGKSVWIDGHTTWKDRKTHGRMIDRQTDRQTETQTDRQTNRETDRHIDRQTGRQTDRHIAMTDKPTETDRQTGRRYHSIYVLWKKNTIKYENSNHCTKIWN